MKIRIEIISEKCIKCKDCIEICPVDIFKYNSEKELVEIINPNECIECCGCVEICPTNAIIHSICSNSY